jgi:hypothetical protein
MLPVTNSLRNCPSGTIIVSGRLYHLFLFMTRINPDGLRELRLLAVERDTRLQTLMIEAINDLLRKYRRPAVASNPLTQFSENSE